MSIFEKHLLGSRINNVCVKLFVLVLNYLIKKIAIRYFE